MTSIENKVIIQHWLVHSGIYRIAGIFGGIKICQIANFLCLANIGRHVSLSMGTVNENGGLNFGKQ